MTHLIVLHSAIVKGDLADIEGMSDDADVARDNGGCLSRN